MRESGKDAGGGDGQMDVLVGVEEAARSLGCHGDTVRRLILTGRLPAVKVVGRWRIDPADLATVVERFPSDGPSGVESPAGVSSAAAHAAKGR